MGGRESVRVETFTEKDNEAAARSDGSCRGLSFFRQGWCFQPTLQEAGFRRAIVEIHGIGLYQRQFLAVEWTWCGCRLSA